MIIVDRDNNVMSDCLLTEKLDCVYNMCSCVDE